MNDMSSTRAERATNEQAAFRWSICWRGKTGVVIIICAFLILSCVVAMSFLLVLIGLSKSCRTKGIKGCTQSLAAKVCGGVFIVLFFLGGVCTIIFFHKKRRKRSSREVAVSEIPAEDLEKSPSPMLPYNHTPHRSPFGEASSIGLPDYFTVVQNAQEVSSQFNAGFWTEDIDGSDDENSPPCYEEALKMTKLSATSTDQQKQHEQGSEDVEDVTRL